MSPTFMARSDALYAVGFHPVLDGEWALLDLSLRISQAPLVERQVQARAKTSAVQHAEYPRLPGLRHAPAAAALCPFVSLREVHELGGPHLLGRKDLPKTGISAAAAWFGEELAAVGPAHMVSLDAPHLRPYTQFRNFMQANELREFVGPDGVQRHSGCNLEGGNCPVPQWVYRGWAAPPCCKETMRHLLFYAGDVLDELNIRYIITDGVLLGSYKYGSMLDWDADVDLHIHDDDFHRLADEFVPRAAADGHYVRQHENNMSFLLQANDKNFLLIELNRRKEPWDADRLWWLPVEGRLFPAMEEAHLNLTAWYGLSFFRHRLRHVPEWEEAERPMFCGTPYHFNCVDELQVPGGDDCRRDGTC